MNNILYDFNENVISLMKNFLFKLEGEENLSTFTDDLVDKCVESGRNIIQN